MSRSFALVAFIASAAVGASLSVPARAQQASPLGGVWTLNRSLSEFPRDIGFNPAWATAPPSGDGGQSAASSGGGGGRGRRGSSGGGGGGRSGAPFASRTESYDDARRVKLLTDEARNPDARLIVVDAPAAVTFTNELGQSRTVHPDGREETVEIEGLVFDVTSRRDGDQLVVVYRVDKTREIRYTYAATASPPRLVVDVQFLEKGAGDKARRIYDTGSGTETVTSTGPAPAPGAPGQPASGQPAPEPFDQRPGAEFKGLTSVGILVENLSTQSVACGLNQDEIETALSRKLASGGFTVRRNSDEDTYMYVNIMTSTVAGGMCVSRYDAFLYTQATAKLSYTAKPVLVQVSLMHRGGIGTSVAAAHGTAVVRGLEGYMDVFMTQIRDANQAK